MTYESLKEALAELQQQLQTLTHQFNNFGAHHQAQADEEADELDQFMENNKASLNQDEKQKLAKEIVDVTNKIQEHNKMISLVKPEQQILKA